MALTHCPGYHALTRAGSYCSRCGRRTGRNTYRWQQLRAERKRIDGYRCVYCGSTEDLTVDLDPRLHGNHHIAILNDYVTACRSCNSRRGTTRPRDPTTCALASQLA